MAMSTSEILAKFHASVLDEAIENTRTLAGFHGRDPDEAVKEYRTLRARSEAAALVKALNEANESIAAADSDEAGALAGGAVGRVVLAEDGTVRVNWSLPGLAGTDGSTRSTGVGRKRRFRYFHEGQPLQGSLKGFLLDKYPDSEAAKTIREYEANEEAGESSAKIGAWEAILKDDTIKANFTRQQR